MTKQLSLNYVVLSVISLIPDNNFYRDWQDWLKPEIFPPYERPLATALLAVRRNGGDYLDALAEYAADSTNGAGKLVENVLEYMDMPDEALKHATFGMRDVSEVEAQERAEQKVESNLIPDFKYAAADYAHCPLWYDYIKYSKHRAPDAAEGFHAQCGLALMSAIAARRVKIVGGSEPYTNLFLGIVAKSAQFTKSTASDLVPHVLQETAKLSNSTADKVLKYILSTADSTPEKFIQSRTLASVNLKAYAPEQESELIAKLALIEQRSMYWDEFGPKLTAVRSKDPTVNKLKPMLLEMYKCGRIEHQTISRGIDLIENSYGALLTSFTPADVWGTMADASWHNGTMGRFQLVTPLGQNITTSMPPADANKVPVELLLHVSKYNAWLGLPDISIEWADPDDKHSKTSVTIGDIPEHNVVFGNEVRQALHDYRKKLRSSYNGTIPADLESSYDRLATAVSKITALIASSNAAIEGKSGDVQASLADFNLAVHHSECWWRPSLHDLYNSAVDNTTTPQALRTRKTLEQRVLEKLVAKQTMKAWEVANAFPKDLKPTAEAEKFLEALVSAGKVLKVLDNGVALYSKV